MTAPKPRLLDLFCGAGGAGMGYFRAGVRELEEALKRIAREPTFLPGTSPPVVAGVDNARYIAERALDQQRRFIASIEGDLAPIDILLWLHAESRWWETECVHRALGAERTRDELLRWRDRPKDIPETVQRTLEQERIIASLRQDLDKSSAEREAYREALENLWDQAAKHAEYCPSDLWPLEGILSTSRRILAENDR